MKKAPFTPSLILVGLVAAGAAHAEPYAAWSSSVSDDDRIKVEDSFNSTKTTSYDTTRINKEDNDVTEDNDVAISLSKSHSEDNDYTSAYSSHYQTSEDNDVSKWYSHSEDNDVSKQYTRTEDNDVSEDNDSWYAHSEDNDYTHTEDNDVATDVDVDFQIATPTLNSYKYQSQDAGHEADQQVYGAAKGHDVGVAGGTTVVSAGNDEQNFFGPAMVNNNTNQLPQNNLFVQGSNGAPISQSNTFAGRDMGPKGVFAPIGNTSAAVMGNVGQSSSAGVSQTGDSSNAIQDTMSAPINK